MSFAQNESPALTPARPARRSTYQEAEPLPFGNGYFRVAPKWITDRFNDHWSNGSQTGQAFCSVAGLLCHGPVSKVRLVLKDGASVALIDLERSDNPADPNYHFVSFEFGGVDAQLGVTNKGRLYWGREDQPADAWLRTKTGQHHPRYGGQCYVIFERLHCGQIQANSGARPALPSIEFSLIRLLSPSMPEGLRLPPALGAALFRGVNPVSAIYDLLTHPRGGLGLVGTLDDDDWEEKAAALESGDKPAGGASGFDIYISPLHAGEDEAEKLVSDYLSYIDGFLYVRGGKLRVDWFPNDGEVPDGLPEITHHDLVKVLELSTGTYAEAPTQIVVAGLDALPGEDAEADLVEAAETAQVPFIRELTGGENRVEKLDRPWFVARDTLSAYAHRVAATRTVPAQDGKFIALASRAVKADGSPLRPGDLVKLNWEPLQLLVVARITERMDAESGVEFTWERERGITPLPYVAGSDPRADYSLPDPATPGVDDWHVVPAPAGLADIGAAVFVRRAQDTLSGVRVHFDPTGAWGAAAAILGSQGFAVRVALAAGIASGAAAANVTTADTDASAVFGSGANSTDQENNDLILVVGGEWISVGAVVSTGPGAYQFALARGRFGSTAAAHAAGAFGWVVRRERLTVWQHAAFAAEGTGHFKVQTYHPREDSALSTEKTVVFPAAPVDGTINGYTIVLSKEAHVVACASDGTPVAGQLGAGSSAKTIVSVVQGNTPLAAVATAPAAGQFSIALGALGSTAATKESNTTVRCDSLTADVGTIEIVISVGGAFTVSKVFTLTKAKAGSPGSPGTPSTVPGPTGNTVERRYLRSTLVPGTPFGDNPSGWSINIPSGSDAVWASEAVKDPSGHVVGSWSTPQRLSGNVIFYPNGNPATVLSGYALFTGDLAFDISDGNQPYRYNGSSWIAQPFGDAAIANLAAGKITAGVIQAAISIGSLGSLSAGSGFGQFFVDSTQLKHGVMTVAQYPSLSGTQLDIATNNHQATLYAHSSAAALLIQNNITGKRVFAFDTGEMRSNTVSVTDSNNPRNSSAPGSVNGGMWIGGACDVSGDITNNGGWLKLNASGRQELGGTFGRSVVVNTNSSERWVFGTDGHFKTFGGDIRKVSSDSWSPALFDGNHTIEWRWSGGLQVRIDGSTVLNVSTY